MGKVIKFNRNISKTDSENNYNEELYKNNKMIRMYHPRVTEKEVREIEERFGFKYPKELKNHLLHYNGAQFQKKHLILSYDDVECIDFSTIGLDKYNKNFGALGREMIKGEDSLKKVFSYLSPFYVSYHPYGYNVVVAYGCSTEEGDEGSVYKCSIYEDKIEKKRLADSLTELMNKLVSEEELDTWQNETIEVRREHEKKLFEDNFKNEEIEASVLIQSDIVQIHDFSAYNNIKSVHKLLWVNAFVKEVKHEERNLQKAMLEMLILPQDIEKYESLFKEDSILKVKLIKHNKSKEELRSMTESYMISEIINTDFYDEDLTVILNETRKEISFDDEILGKFTLNRRLYCFEGRTKYKNQNVDLSIDFIDKYNENDIKKVSKLLRGIVKNIKMYDKKARIFGCEKVINEKNEYYSDENSKALTSSDYAKKVSLESINIDMNESIEFWYKDGEGDYGIASICVNGTVEKGFTDASIH